MSHPHTHGGPALGPASARTRLILAAVLAPFVAGTLVGLVLLWPEGGPSPVDRFATERAHGTVLDVHACDNGVPECLSATVDLTRGGGAPDRVEASIPFGERAPEVSEGDRILLTYVAEALADQRYVFQDFDRGRPLAALLACSWPAYCC